MTRRAIELLLLVALGAVAGWIRGTEGWTFGGALVGALVWSILDGLRARRVLRWLNKGEVSRAPDLSGIWPGTSMTGVPLQRPPELGDRRFLTDEELAAFWQSAEPVAQRKIHLPGLAVHRPS